MDSFNGLLVLDKAARMTSRAAVDRALRWFPRKTRIGHTGTLDPLATGVLVLCVGAATRLVEYIQRMNKTYETTLLLGAESDTDDAEGVIIPVADAQPPSLDAITRSASSFIGIISQVPPAHSAAKIEGRRAYSLARQGATVELEPRQVNIYRIDVKRYEWPHLDLEIQCGKGTYIRSLARDLGQRLGCGALVETLRRTQVGPFTPERAVPLDADTETARACLLPMELAAAELPRIVLDAAHLGKLRQGQPVALDDVHAGEAAVFDETGKFVAVAEATAGVLRPAKVFG